MTEAKRVVAPIVVVERPHRHWAAGIASSVAIGSTLLASLTLAAFTDHEFAALNHGPDGGPGYGIGTYNVQIRVAGGDSVWHDTTMMQNGEPDNLPQDTEQPIVLLDPKGDKIVPGEPASYPTVKFEVRNDERSNLDSLLSLRLYQAGTTYATTDDGVGSGLEAQLDGSAGGVPASDSVLLAALRFDVTVTGPGLPQAAVWTDATFADLTTSFETPKFVISPSAAPGAVYAVTIKVKLPDQGSPIKNSAFQGKHAYLLAAVEGSSVVA
ncbi:MAG: hypothetical protein LBJ44_05230 [Propionibacteriaceae bacterium]|jgi:hypothetical protein|nr:hypothetical protein [Propionibacteriaceae bacterium]